MPVALPSGIWIFINDSASLALTVCNACTGLSLHLRYHSTPLHRDVFMALITEVIFRGSFCHRCFRTMHWNGPIRFTGNQERCIDYAVLFCHLHSSTSINDIGTFASFLNFFGKQSPPFPWAPQPLSSGKTHLAMQHQVVLPRPETLRIRFEDYTTADFDCCWDAELHF